MPKLSIIIPAYNIKDYIAYCLDSIIGQKYSDMEIIIVDDGSQDGTAGICDAFARQHDFIQVIHKPNEGVSAARNLGLQRARGKYTMFVDGDDSLADGSLAEAMRLTERDAPDMAIFRAQTVTTSYAPIGECFPFPPSATKKDFSGADLFCNHTYYRSSSWGALYLTEFLHRHNAQFLKGIANGEDGIFMAYLYANNPSIRFYDILLYNVTERPGSASRSWDKARFIRMAQTLAILLRELKRPDLTKLQESIIEYELYSFVSTIFDSLAVTPSWRLRHEVIVEIEHLLQGHTITTPMINRARTKIKILNTSVRMFFLLKWVITHIRRMKGQR